MKLQAPKGTKDIFFDEAKTWQFIEENVVNKEYGEWYNKITPDGEPYSDCGKVSIWKGPYHNARACMELIDRLERIIE